MTGYNKLNLVMLAVLVCLPLFSGIHGYPKKSSGSRTSNSRCSNYVNAYYKLKQAISTCSFVNNYACRDSGGYASSGYTGGLFSGGPAGAWGQCTFRCIPEYQRCDGIVQCPLGDDELNCPPPTTVAPVTTAAPTTAPVVVVTTAATVVTTAAPTGK